MKTIIALLLLFGQLRPLAATALCVHAHSAAAGECGMPAQPTGSTVPIGDSHAPPSADCTGAVVCSPSALGVIPAEGQLELTLPQHPVALPGARSLVTEPPVAPPFHPPRA
jgi:hypothetical protein